MSLAVVEAIASAVCFGVASAGQFAAGSLAPGRGALDPRLLGDLLRKSAWWRAGAVELLAVALQYLSLRGAPLATVQSLLVLGLPVAVLLSGARSRGTLLAVALTCTGLVVFALDQPVQAPPRQSSVAVVVPVAVALLASLLSRRASPVVRGLCAGVVTGCAAAALSATAALAPAQLPGRPQLYVAVVLGLLALQVGQAALQAPQLGPPLAALTVAEPVVAVLLAVGDLRQTVVLGAPAAVGAVLALVGVWALNGPALVVVARV